MADVDPRLQFFVTLFNYCYPNWHTPTFFGDGADKELKPEHVDFGVGLQQYHAKCGPRPGGHIYYRLKAESWSSWDWPRRVQLIIHELAHVKHTDHSPEFWEQTVDNYWALHDRKDSVDDAIREYADWQGDIIDYQLDWDKVAEHLVHNPNNSMVDNRVETAYERQLKLADALNYPKDEIPPFNGMRIYTVRKTNNHKEVSVKPDEVEYDEYDTEELVRHFRARPRPGIDYDGRAYIIDSPKAVEKPDGGYRVVEGHKRAGIIQHAHIDNGDRDTLPLNVVDSDDYESGNAAVAVD